MSASAKKKLRKEENAAQLTEKQLAEQKEAKKLKLYTTIFVVAIVVVLVAGLIIAGFNFVKNSGIKEKNTVAAVIGDHEINAVEMSYYYTDTLDSNYKNWANTYGDSMSLYMSLMGLDLTQPLSAQTYSDGTTWADYFVDIALSAAQRDYLMADLAKAEGYALSEDSQAMLEQTFDNLPAFASIYGYNNVDSYLRGIYGAGASEETYRQYAERSALASDYYSAYVENLEVTDAEIRAYEADKVDEYSSYSYASYVISYSHYLTGGTEDAEGNVTYSDDDKEAARIAAKAAATSLPQCTTVEELNAAVAALPASETAPAESTVYNDIVFANLNTNVRDWMVDGSRKAGDFTVVPNETTTTDENGVETTEVNSYTAYLFTGRNDNNVPMGNVRHILVNFEGGTAGDNGTMVYTDDEKAAAKEEAEGILELYMMGEQTEDAFAELATANSDDTGSIATGGLYEDIAPIQGVYVESFTNWATDPAREVGDTGIIESTYGYHVMYYVGDSELSYRDHLIREDIEEETIGKWYDEILATGEVVEKDTSALNKDIILAQ